ncbi:hypothetical protein E2C01_093164 [Portunus trituberculatus]|uniref:Uncharacterized protein n=1 Tax=Portunus trituberculatus TaxID=210409 RepID=A0A5B7JSJ7_PORTR|nr:hypothetical protein [Portunus trituberculatus]
MMKVTQQETRGRVASSLLLCLWLISSLLYFLVFHTVTPPPEVVFPAPSEQPESNLVTVPPSVHGYHFAARGCSDVKESWIKLQEPANYNETTPFGPSPGKFKSRKFAKTDVIVRYADFWSNFILYVKLEIR